MSGNDYTERYWDLWRVVAGGVNFMRTQLFGKNGTSLVEVAVDANGNLLSKSPSDSYVLGNDGTNVTTFTRASDSKVLTITYVAGIPTAISDWI